ncbi:MAG: hypothetical protein HUJ96_09100 [Marinilabiliaceae bacterium]|nr:hypothetical protein [Marinilabiliaceae bacterium]
MINIQKIRKQFNVPSWMTWRFMLYLAGLMFLYINNVLLVNDHIREVAMLKKELDALMYERIRTSSELMDMSKQSEILRRIESEHLNLHELTEPPRQLKN